LGAIRTGLICSVAALIVGIIVLKIVHYTPAFNAWPHNALVTGYAGKALILFSLLLVLNEFIVTHHPFYEIWLLAALGGAIGVLAW
jgi:hypothetical protein